MVKRRNITTALSVIIVTVLMIILLPIRASGEVKPIEELQQKLEGISAEEQEVLVKLFAITQDIEGLEGEEKRLTEESDLMQAMIQTLEKEILEKESDYSLQLDILKQVLINYQQGGPGSYLEILFAAESLSEFLKSMNLLKDISYNVNELLESIELAKDDLEKEKASLNEQVLLLEQTKLKLQDNIHRKQSLKEEQETYLASLKQDREGYEEQLSALETMWEDSRLLFSDIVDEFSGIIHAGYFTMEDLNISFGFFKVKGAIAEDTFNRILSDNSKLTETIFHFEDQEVIIQVPDKHLVLTGEFSISGDTAIRFDVKEGSFYELPLEQSSMDELFVNGPMTIDFGVLAADMLTIDFTLEQVESKDGMLNFVIIPKW